MDTPTLTLTQTLPTDTHKPIPPRKPLKPQARRRRHQRNLRSEELAPPRVAHPPDSAAVGQELGCAGHGLEVVGGEAGGGWVDGDCGV